MASFFRRKRSLIFKLVIGVPALWFFIVIFLSYQDKGDGDENSNHNQRIRVHERSVFENPLDRIKNAIVKPVKADDRDNGGVGGGGNVNQFKQEFNVDHRNQNEDDDNEALKFEKPDPNSPGRLFGRFTFERIHNTKEQIYFYERAENHKAKERLFESFK